MAEVKKPAPVAGAKKVDTKTPRERTLTVGAGRVSRAISAIRGIKNITSRKSYEYTEAEANKVVSTLRAEVDAIDAAYKAALAGKSATAEKEKFSFA